MKLAVSCLAILFFLSCGSTTTEEIVWRTLPDPLFLDELPDPPAEVPPDKRMVLSVSECIVEGSDPPSKTAPGILMSQEMAMRAARLKVSYDEMRGLYKVDLATMDRERGIYERHLKAADDEIIEWRERSRRSWWEKNRGLVGLVGGVVVGAAMTIGIAAAIDQATE